MPSTESMKAARFHGRLDLRVDDVSKPVPKGDEVLIDVEWCGICGTDLHEYQHGLQQLSSLPDSSHFVLT